MSYPKTVANYNAFIDGVDYFGLVEEATLPVLKLQTEAHRGAGMDGAIGVPVGIEAMTASATFAEWNPTVLKKFGNTLRLVLRPYATSAETGAVTEMIVTIGGLITTAEFDPLKSGTPSKLKIEWDVRTFKLEIDGEEIHHIDPARGKRLVDKVDQLAEARRAMGL